MTQAMSEHIDPDELSAEQEFEMRAAFGDEAVDNGDLVDVTEDLKAAAEADDEVVHDAHAFPYNHCPDCRRSPLLQPVKGKSQLRCLKCDHTVEAER